MRRITTQSRGPPWKHYIHPNRHPARRSLILVVRRLMLENLSQLTRITNLSVQEIADASIICIASKDSFSIIVTVPNSVLEWFAAISENEKEIWTDYYPINNESHIQLREWMSTDIINFVQTASKTQLRKVTSKGLFRTKENVEWLIDGTWKIVTMSGV